MKENEELESHNQKPQGTATVSSPQAKASNKENAQQKGGEKRKPKSDRLSRAAGQRK